MDRKILAILTLFTLGLTLAGCSSDSVPAPDVPGDELVTIVLDISVNNGAAAPEAGRPSGEAARSGGLRAVTTDERTKLPLTLGREESRPYCDAPEAATPAAPAVCDGSEAATPGSRASEDVDFEGPATDYEKVKELRVIITRPNAGNIVEHNAYMWYDALWETLTGSQYKVVGGEMKAIYLIANESGLPQTIQDQLKGITAGEVLMVDLPSLLIDVESGQPFIDNTGAESHYIPMTESYDILVPKAETLTAVKTEVVNGVTITTKVFDVATPLFITRTTTKFSFVVRGKNSTLSRGMKITSITFTGKTDGTGLGTEEYLFPRNTIYSPAKYTPSTEKLNGREIISFAVPPTATTYSFTFTPAAFGLNRAATSDKGLTGLTQTFVPFDYFLESGLREFYVTVETLTDDDIVQSWTGKLTNLPSLPRNTHVAVMFTLTDATFSAIVKLVPYIGVDLTYTFGFDQLYDWDRKPNGQVLPVDPNTGF